MLSARTRNEVVVSGECTRVRRGEVQPLHELADLTARREAGPHSRKQKELMRKSLTPDFHDRRKDAAKARSALLAKFNAAPRPDDPLVIEKRREREAIARAREARQAERERARQAEQAAREHAAAEAERIAAEEAARAAAEAAEREAALKAEQKAARDERYAARKLAKKERRKGTARVERRYRA